MEHEVDVRKADKIKKNKIPKPWVEVPVIPEKDSYTLFVYENNDFLFEIELASIQKQKYHYAFVCEFHGEHDYSSGFNTLKYKTLEEGISKLNVIIPKIIAKIMKDVYRRNNKEIEFLMKVNSRLKNK